MARWLVPIVLVSLFGSACGGKESNCDDGEDNDGDSFVDCFDQDCADSCGEVCGNLLDDNGDGAIDCLDPLCADQCPTSPVASEDCANGLDDDRDQLTDCEDGDCALRCDGDADGWIDEAYGGLDCDDDEPDVHPGGTETPYNGLDDDCDPTTPDDDVDGDGYLLAEDCAGKADSDAFTYPGAPETCGDGIANDCYDVETLPDPAYCFGDRPAWTADGILYGPSASGLAGYALAMIPDSNDDGGADLVIGAYGDGATFTGGVYLFLPPVTGEVDLAISAHKWLGETLESYAGFAVAGGVDLVAPGTATDGSPDVIIGVPNDDESGNDAGGVYIGPSTAPGSQTELLDVNRKVLGEGAEANAGAAVAGLGDVDGDDFDDLAVGSPGAAEGLDGAGAAHVVFGPVLGTVSLDTVGYRIAGMSVGDRVGCAVARGNDIDGDGLADLLVGACGEDNGGTDGGAVGVFSTHLQVDRTIGDADGLAWGGAGDALGTALAGGDLDDDGLADVLAGAPGDNGRGSVVLYEGPALGALSAAATFSGETSGDAAGTSLAVAGDVDGDGLVDVSIGATGNDAGGQDAGAAYVLFGPFGGQHDLADADVQILGAAPFDLLGQSVAGGLDADGDGRDDVFVGAPYHDGLNPAAGAAYLFTFDW